MREVAISSQSQSLMWDESEIVRLFHSLDTDIADFAIPAGELSVVFLDTPAMIQLHAAFLHDPTPTDVITFPGDPEAEFAGEICACVEVAAQAAEEHQEPFARELTRYLVHGWLHLAGLSDHSPGEYTQMKSKEAYILTHLETAKLMPEFIFTATI